MEVETPILQPIPGGARAAPFKTHFNAMDMDVYLRIAPELYLKRLLVAGFNKIFEIGKDFRNEGIDSDHYPEFTMMELYWAYKDYNFLMDKVENWFCKVCGKICEDGGRTFERVEYKKLIEKYAPEEVENLNTVGIDEVFKKMVRPNIVEPTFVIDHPAAVSPLAKRKENEPEVAERFQLIARGTELVNGFSELNDPDWQRKIMEEQEKMREAGDEEASRFDAEFIEALELVMPPAAELGIGIDRLSAYITGAGSIRETMTFTVIKPKL